MAANIEEAKDKAAAAAEEQKPSGIPASSGAESGAGKGQAAQAESESPETDRAGEEALPEQAPDLEIRIKKRTAGHFFSRKVLLKDIQLCIHPGKMVLILGGSGAGKTTFINAVTGYEKANASITLGSLDMYRDYEKMKYKVGMVPQQDLLRGDDSVRMTLLNAAEMRMQDKFSEKERKERVDEVIRLFGLDSVKGQLVEKLSGGQRKRLSIAVEFVADPSIFILDEPDSGLDGVMARDLMQQLRTIADEGRIVMVITHTPDRVIDLFDQVIVLAKDKRHTGRLAFFGDIQEARKFFKCGSMEEIVLSVNSTHEGGAGQADFFIAKYASLQRVKRSYAALRWKAEKE